MQEFLFFEIIVPILSPWTKVKLLIYEIKYQNLFVSIFNILFFEYNQSKTPVQTLFYLF